LGRDVAVGVDVGFRVVATGEEGRGQQGSHCSAGQSPFSATGKVVTLIVNFRLVGMEEVTS
jgi:hypothetical protein